MLLCVTVTPPWVSAHQPNPSDSPQPSWGHSALSPSQSHAMLTIHHGPQHQDEDRPSSSARPHGCSERGWDGDWFYIQFGAMGRSGREKGGDFRSEAMPDVQLSIIKQIKHSWTNNFRRKQPFPAAGSGSSSRGFLQH